MPVAPWQADRDRMQSFSRARLESCPRILEPYERYVTASTQTMTANPGQVAGELTGRFVRSIGVENLPSVTAVPSG